LKASQKAYYENFYFPFGFDVYEEFPFYMDGKKV